MACLGSTLQNEGLRRFTMVENKSDFSIIFEELDKLSKEPDVRLTSDELKEYEEIRTLREIVLEIQSPIKTYLTST